jgi:hypothetical protein
MLRTLRNLVILVVVVAVTRTCIQHFGERKLAKAVEKANAEMPVVVDGRIRLEKIEYSNHAVRYSGAFLGDHTVSQREKDAFEQDVTQFYCHGRTKAFADAKVPLEYSIKTQTDTLAVSVTPDKCR